MIVAFPAAGAGAAMYRRWVPSLANDTELVVVTAPGREHRIAEPPIHHVAAIADAVVADLVALERHVTLFGHSAGALIGFEVATRMPTDRVEHLLVAAATPPDIAETNYALMTDADLIASLRAWGGTPEEVLDESSIMELVLPGLRADLAVAHSCRTADADHPVLDTPITALVGSSDRFATVDQAAGWARFTASAFALDTVAGGHFFPADNSSDVVARIIATFGTTKGSPSSAL